MTYTFTLPYVKNGDAIINTTVLSSTCERTIGRIPNLSGMFTAIINTASSPSSKACFTGAFSCKTSIDYYPNHNTTGGYSYSIIKFDANSYNSIYKNAATKNASAGMKAIALMRIK